MTNKNKALITVTQETRRKLNMWKYQLNCKNLDELLERILLIIPASKMELQKNE